LPTLPLRAPVFRVPIASARLGRRGAIRRWPAWECGGPRDGPDRGMSRTPLLGCAVLDLMDDHGHSGASLKRSSNVLWVAEQLDVFRVPIRGTYVRKKRFVRPAGQYGKRQPSAVRLGASATPRYHRLGGVAFLGFTLNSHPACRGLSTKNSQVPYSAERMVPVAIDLRATQAEQTGLGHAGPGTSALHCAGGARMSSSSSDLR